MRKNNYLLILIAALAVSMFAFGCGCGGNKKPAEPTYVVHFETNGAELIPDQVLKAGEQITEPAAPTRDYYDFAGWYDASYLVRYSFGLMPASDITVYAKWDPKISVKVQFNSNGGTAVTDAVVLVGEKIEEPTAPTKTGYVFSGWVDNNGTAFNFQNALISDSVLYASWTEDENYAFITYYIDGKFYAEVPVLKNTKVEPIATDDEYISDNWFSDPEMSTVFSFDQPITQSVSLYSQIYSAGLVITNGVVTGYTGSTEAVLIPSYYNGVAVTAIADSAFSNNRIIHSVEIPATVTRIGEYAFYNCWYLASINLSDNVTEIGAYAFFMCENLREVGSIIGLSAINQSVFSGCKLLKSVTMSDKVKIIGELAFNDCESLTELYLSSQLTTIGRSAFSGCKMLESLTLPSSLETLANNVFKDCLSLKSVTVSNNPNFRNVDGNLCSSTGEFIMYLVGEKSDTEFTIGRNQQTIRSNAFLNNSNIKKLVIPSTVRNIECGALYGMNAIEELEIYFLGDGNENAYLSYLFGAETALANGSKSVYVPESLKKVTINGTVNALADYAFYGCSSVTEIVGIDNITAIGTEAFAFCGIEEVQITASINNLDYTMFNGAANLTAINVAANNTFFKSIDGVVYNKAGTELQIVPAGKTELTIPDTVTKINSGAFRYSSITELEIPATVTSLELGALRGMQSIETLTTPYIGDGSDANNYMLYAFGSTVTQTETDGRVTTSISSNSNYPTTLRNINISKALTELPKFAFIGCLQLENIGFNKDTTYTAIPDYCFYNTSIEELYITEDVTSVGQFAYAYCSKLTNVYIPGNVKTLNDYSFGYSRNINKVEFGEGVETIGKYAFVAEISSQNVFTLVAYSNLQEIIFSSTIKTIDEYAFAYTGMMFDSSTSTNLPIGTYVVSFPNGSNLERIEQCAFYYCGIAGTVEFSSTVRVIGESAFESCNLLEVAIFGNATDGSNLEEVSGTAFAFCNVLKNLTFYIYPETVEEVTAIIPFVYNNVNYIDIAYDCPNCNIYVPAESFDIIKLAQHWSSVKNLKSL